MDKKNLNLNASNELNEEDLNTVGGGANFYANVNSGASSVGKGGVSSLGRASVNSGKVSSLGRATTTQKTNGVHALGRVQIGTIKGSKTGGSDITSC
ncbi:MAG: hypothetical protein K6B75_08160 [Lachnospiraceae bacterium]|nr:hypothetical protein [Lachnospiraceae bacterium]